MSAGSCQNHESKTHPNDMDSEEEQITEYEHQIKLSQVRPMCQIPQPSTIGLDNKPVKKSMSWLRSWFSRKKSNPIHLPDDYDKKIVWDEEKKRWVNKDDQEEDNALPTPSLNDIPLAPPVAQTVQDGPPQMTANRYSLKNRGGNRSMYKNAVFASSKSVVVPAPVDFPGIQIAPIVSGFMTPNPVSTSQPQEARDESNHSPPDVPCLFMEMSSKSGRIAGRKSFDVPNTAPLGLTSTLAQDVGCSAGPTMFVNPSQREWQAQHPDLHPMDRDNSMGRGRPVYPGQT